MSLAKRIIPYLDEFDALDHTAVINVETGNNAFGE